MKRVQTLHHSTREIAWLGLFLAFTFVGSLLKIPSPAGTVALDAAPAFLAALFFGPWMGGIVGFAGHLLSALYVGFPLTLPMHLIIGSEMFIICAVVGGVARFHSLFSLIIGWLLNSFAAPALFIFLPGLGFTFFLTMVVPLMIGSAVNLLIAGLVFSRLKGKLPI